MKYLVKLDKWPIIEPIEANSEGEATAQALAKFPTCICCDEPMKVEWAKQA